MSSMIQQHLSISMRALWMVNAHKAKHNCNKKFKKKERKKDLLKPHQENTI